MVIDPELSCDQRIMLYFAFLRSSSNDVKVLTRVLEGPLSKVGDYQLVPPDDGSAGGPHAGVRERTATGLTNRAVFYARNNTASAYNWAKAAGLDPDEARDRQLDVEAAIALKADIYVTDSRFALSQKLTGKVFACSPSEAMAIVGLHQRLQGRLLVNTGLLPETLGLPEAEYVQAWALLPNTLDLFARRVPPPADPTRWRDLVRVARVRLERCLRARDQILVQSIYPTLRFPFDSNDALVERIALNLSATFDALARAINAVNPIESDETKCSLINDRFRARLPAPVKAVVATSDSLALLRAMSILRNTIHHVALSHAAESDGMGKVSENYVVLPASETTKFRQHAVTLQKTSQWIAKDFDEYGLILKPVSLIEDLVTQSVLLFETVVSTAHWPGTIDEDLRVRSDDPVEWWMYYSPTVNLVASLYGLESD